MNCDEASQELRRMYVNAPQGWKAIQPILFGIKYDKELEGLIAEDILQMAGLPRSYGGAIHSGRRLAWFVELRAGR